MSVRVIDHMPPIDEYSITMPPPMMTDRVRSVPNSTLKMVAYAMVDVTESMSVYATMTMPDALVAFTP